MMRCGENKPILWELYELEYLKHVYAAMTAKAIAKELGVKTRRVQDKARALGLRKYKKDNT